MMFLYGVLLPGNLDLNYYETFTWVCGMAQVLLDLYNILGLLLTSEKINNFFVYFLCAHTHQKKRLRDRLEAALPKGHRYLWNIPYTVNIYCCDWFNKESDWPIAGQEKVSYQPDTERKQEVQDEREVTPCAKMQININALTLIVRVSQ